MKQFDLTMQSKYLRIPFKEHRRDFSGCDCGGLVWLVYKEELGIELPDWREGYTSTQIEHGAELESTLSTMLGENGHEVDLQNMQPFDVIAFRINGLPMHVGIAINNHYFMHIMQGKTQVCLERIGSVQWEKRISGVYRYGNL